MPSRTSFKKCDFCARTVRIDLDGTSYNVVIDQGLYKVCSKECEERLRANNKQVMLEVKNGGM